MSDDEKLVPDAEVAAALSMLNYLEALAGRSPRIPEFVVRIMLEEAARVRLGLPTIRRASSIFGARQELSTEQQ